MKFALGSSSGENTSIATDKGIQESQIILHLPMLNSNVKNVYREDEEEGGECLMCEIYVYKDQQLVKKLKKPFKELRELEDFIKIKYSKRYIS